MAPRTNKKRKSQNGNGKSSLPATRKSTRLDPPPPPQDRENTQNDRTTTPKASPPTQNASRQTQQELMKQIQKLQKNNEKMREKVELIEYEASNKSKSDPGTKADRDCVKKVFKAEETWTFCKFVPQSRNLRRRWVKGILKRAGIVDKRDRKTPVLGTYVKSWERFCAKLLN